MDGFARRFAEFATALTQAKDFDDTGDQLVSYAVETLGASCGGITLLRPHDRLETISATEQRVIDVDRAQYELREGPCVDAATEARSLRSGDLGQDPRWPSWGPAAADMGFCSVLSAEIHGRGMRIGALNLYSTDQDAFSPEDVELAKILATQSAAVMAAMESENGLREALQTRTLIGQAQGILMERFEIDADQAFSVLRRFSQNTNTALREVAEELVRTRAVS